MTDSKKIVIIRDSNSVKAGDTLTLEMYGLGKGEVEVRMNGNELCLFDEEMGYYPVSKAIDNKDILLTKTITHDKDNNR